MTGEAQGLGNYLMDAAQKFGDHLMAIFDRIGELGAGAVSAATGAFGKAAPVVALSTTTGDTAPSTSVTPNAPSTPDTGMSQGTAQEVSNVIALPAVAVTSLQSIRDNPINMEWASADRGDVLGNLPKPPPTPNMPIERGTGVQLA